MSRLPRFPRLALGAVALVMLAATGACTSDNDELSQWMEQQHKEVRPNVPPVYPPKKFDPQPYLGNNGVEPFGTQKLVAINATASQRSSAVLAVAQKHQAQELEAFPLDSMTMVGTLLQGGRSHALLMVDNRLHDVKVGDWIGQNYGQVTRITETEISLHETVQDATGEWIERTSTLQLQEKAR